MKPTITLVLFTLLVLIATPSLASKPDRVKENKNQGDGNNYVGYFGPGGGFSIPGFGNGIMGGGYGGSSKGGIIRPTLVCKDRGPCYQKKLTCPAKCFSSFTRSGKGYGAGGGGCTIDCKNKCIAYC